MVTLYIWKPTTAETVLEREIVPDVGHAAMEVTAENGATQAYISFWPELESAVGVISQLWKPRTVRHPISYDIETDHEAGYMQRPTDYAVYLVGMRDDVIVRLWQELSESTYDFLTWNCSNVCKFLLLSAVPPECRVAMQEAMALCPDDINCIDSADSTLEKLRFLSTSTFIDCRPEDLKRAADAYIAATTKESDPITLMESLSNTNRRVNYPADPGTESLTGTALHLTE